MPGKVVGKNTGQSFSGKFAVLKGWPLFTWQGGEGVGVLLLVGEDFLKEGLRPSNNHSPFP